MNAIASDGGFLSCVSASLAGSDTRLTFAQGQSVNVTASDSGSLLCVLASLAGPVIRLPQLTYGGSANVTATAGQTARLPCNIQDLGDRAVSRAKHSWNSIRVLSLAYSES